MSTPSCGHGPDCSCGCQGPSADCTVCHTSHSVGWPSGQPHSGSWQPHAPGSSVGSNMGSQTISNDFGNSNKNHSHHVML